MPITEIEYRASDSCLWTASSNTVRPLYGAHVTLGEALTQNQVAQIVNADPKSAVRVLPVYLVFLRERCRYIVKEYIAGETVAHRQPSPDSYAKGDLEAVAAAVKHLISLRMPRDTSPGPVGGGRIGHDFFVDCISDHEYPTLEISRPRSIRYAFRLPSVPRIDTLSTRWLVAARRLRVDYTGEIAEGLVLCPSDIDPSNFIVDREGKVFAIDFGRTCYMPPSYVSYSLTHWKPFTKRVASLVKYPESANLYAMQVAAGLLVISGNNSSCIDRKP
ncbi:hypothetical protein B0H21DRAFT_818644 [Amylocystis lapponica]|nr:hypothetical protein B0H21DRAFT_818644 [Amylocystis lapponica]